MELKYSGQFNRDVAHRNRELSDEIHHAILNVKKAINISEIQNLVKLKKYKVHYRIKIANDYRIGIIIRGNKVWFTCFGHRNTFYKYFP